MHLLPCSDDWQARDAPRSHRGCTKLCGASLRVLAHGYGCCTVEVAVYTPGCGGNHDGRKVTEQLHRGVERGEAVAQLAEQDAVVVDEGRKEAQLGRDARELQ